MTEESGEALTDKGRLLFGAGFVFGVMFTMLILAVVTATVGGNTGSVEATNVFVTITAGIFFAGVVGVALYFLAFPENRVEIPVGQRLADIAASDGESDDQADDS